MTIVSDGEDKKVTAGSFALQSFKGCEVKGETYYVNKAVKLGAKKTK